MHSFTHNALLFLADAASQSVAAGGGRGFLINMAYLAAAACFIIGLIRLSSPRTAGLGNITSSVGMLIAVIATLADPRIMDGGGYWLIALGLLVGCAIGATFALRVHMRGMPQMVALLNGFGGMAAAMVGYGEYLKEAGHLATTLDFRISVALSLMIGIITFTGSLVAWAKLEEIRIPQAWIPIPSMREKRPKGLPLTESIMIPFQQPINIAIVAGVLILAVILALSTFTHASAIGILALAAVFGFLLVLPIGGADMPVVIAMLNSFSGLGAAATGFVLTNNALIIGGTLVGASGLILTLIMCKSMNRSLLNVIAGGFGGSETAAAAGGPAGEKKTVRQMDPEEAAMLLEGASNVIIIPGYGMAVAQAQHAVAEMTNLLKSRGVSVKFAVHPVAGRMPGHMNVLLAEANIPYELLADLEINPEFEQCDAAIVIGANDVVNPAARTDKSSPIYGMPIFDADKSKTVMVLKRSMNPGYAGIENELFYLPNTVMLFGDAKQTISSIVTELKNK